MDTKAEFPPSETSVESHTLKRSAYIPHEALSGFREIAERHLDTCLTGWCSYHRERLTEFQSLMQTCLTNLSQHTDLSDIWQESQRYFHGLQSWIEASANATETATLDEVLFAWSEVSDTWAVTVPVKATVPVTTEDWISGTGDSIRIRAWKQGWRLRHAISRVSHSRTYSPKDLIQYHLTLPFQAFLIQEWEYLQDLVVRQFADLYQIPHDLGLKCLHLETNDEAWKRTDVDHISSQCDTWTSNTEKVDAAFQQIAAYRQDSDERFARWFEGIAAEHLRQTRFAGTFILPATAFGERACDRLSRETVREFDEKRKAWYKLIEAEQDDWALEIDLKCIQFQAGIAYFELQHHVEGVLTQQVLPTFSASLPPVREALHTIEHIDTSDTAALEKSIKKEKRDLVRALRRQHLPQMTDALLKADLDQAIAELTAQIERPIESLPPMHRIVYRRHPDRFPPVSDVEDIPIKTLLEDRDFSLTQTSTQAVRSELHQDLNAIIQRLSEVDQVVEFNLNAALSLISEDQNPTDARQTVIDGLQRATNQIEQSYQECEEIQGFITQHTFNLIHNYLLDIQKLLDNDEVLQLKLQMAQAQAKDRYRHYRAVTWTAVRRAIPWLLASGASFGRRIYGHYRRLNHMAGLETAPSTNLQQFLVQTQQRLSNLPYVYQRVFHPETETDRRFLAGRDEELALLSEDFERWQQGHYMTTVIVGESGCGRSTVLQFAVKGIYKKQPVRRIVMDKTVYTQPAFMVHLKQAFPELAIETLDDLESALLVLESPCVCVVESIQNLFLKTVDGFDLLEQFLLIMSRTHRKVYWVLTCTLYSWEYLQKVVDVAQYFQRCLSLDELSQTHMQSIIMKRHRVTGYHAQYEPPESVRQSRRFKKLRDPEDQQMYLEELCFEHLQHVAMGNISVGMLFWLRSITTVRDNTLYINPVIDFDESALTALSPDEMFTLGTILHHETLTGNEHALVFHQAEEISLTQLNLLYNKGILIDANGTFRIHPFLYRPVVQALKRMNILH